MLSSARWSSFRLSKQHLSIALAEAGHDVLYVDPPLSAGSLLRDRSRWPDLRGRDEVGEAGVRVWHPIVLPGQNDRRVQRLNARLLRRGIRRRMTAEDLTLAFSLESRGVLRHLGGRRVYHCTDSAEDLPGANADEVRRQELALIARCDVVAACSRPLVDQLAARGVEAMYLPHGCDREAFVERGGDDPVELRGRARPFVGYVGSINFRIDVRLLVAALGATSGGTLVLVGSRFGPSPAPEVAALLARPDVVVIDQQPPARLAALTASLDVGLAPYGEHPFNRKSFPLKIPQYLAAGVPVVSSPNGATDELGAAVRVAREPDEFGQAVRDAIREGPEGAAARRAVAARRPWSRVAEELLGAARP